MSLLFCFCSCGDHKADKTIVNNITATPEIKSVFINGDSINYLDIGKGEPVVLVHGHVGDYRSWGAQMDTFAIDHRVIAHSRRYAYPNRQVINDSADYTVLPHASDLAELIRTLNLGPVHLVGHSWGAFTALQATIDNPELVRSLVLAEPPVQSLLRYVEGGDTLINNIHTKAFKPAAKAFQMNKTEKAVSIFIGGVTGDSLLFLKMPKAGQDMMMDNMLGLRGFVLNSSFIPISPNDIEKIKTPVLLIKGEKSPLYFRAIVDELDKLILRNELFTLPNASHGLQGENPKDFNKIVLGFINKN